LLNLQKNGQRGRDKKSWPKENNELGCMKINHIILYVLRFSHSKILCGNLSMYKINKLQHGKRFVWDFHTCWWSIRNLTCSLRSLVRFQILQQVVWKSLMRAFHEVISISAMFSIWAPAQHEGISTALVSYTANFKFA